MNMKLKFFIAGAAIVAGLASAVSCQDLSKDLTALQNKVNSLESTVQNLQDKIDGGAVITSVTPTNSGIVITLSNGNKYEITNGVNGKDGSNGTNGKDGKDGSVVTIGENGNWFIDGEDTGMAAAGQDGTPGEYYVPNPETGCFDKYVWVEENGVGAYVKEATEISYLAPGTITAVYDPETGILTLYGVEGGAGEQGIVVIGGAATAVTDIALYNAPAGNLMFTTVTEQTNEFHGLTFTEGTQVQREVNFILKVTPASYELKTSDIELVNSKGTVLDQVEITEVSRYTGEITKAETGLWRVKAEIIDFDKDAFMKAVLVNPALGYGTGAGNQWAFAVKVGDNVTNFALSFEQQAYETSSRPNVLNYVLCDNPSYWWLGTSVNSFINRYATGKELKWATSTTKYPTPATAIVKEGSSIKNAVNDTADDRTAAPHTYYNAILGQPFYVSPGNDDVKAYYITLDASNAQSVDELNTWKTYDISGLDKLVDLDEEYAAICVNSKSAKGDIIGFRVYAVNYDGTLPDPDGKAFYVKVGEQGSEWDAVPITMSTPDNFIDKVSSPASITTKKLATAAKIGFTVLQKSTYGYNPNDELFELTFLDNDKTAINTTTLKNGDLVTLPATGSSIDYWGLRNDDNKQLIKYVKATPVIPATPAGLDLYIFKDDVPYYGVIDIYDADNFLLAEFMVSFTKSMPDGAPSGFSAKTNQIVDGVYKCYLEPLSWTATTSGTATGSMSMTTVFNFPAKAAVASKINIAFNKSDKNASDEWIAVNANNSTPLVIKKKYIDSTTAHATSVTYNYGKISSEDMYDSDGDGDLDSYNDVKKEIMSFNTVYHNIYDTYTWKWNWVNGAVATTPRAVYASITGMVNPGPWTPATATDPDPFAVDTKPVIKYGVGATFNTYYIAGTSSWSATYNALLITPYKNSLMVTPDTGSASGNKEPNVVSKGSSVKDEYFTAAWDTTTGDIVLTPQPTTTASEPAADVESQLVLYVTDMYGKKREIKLDLTIKKP